MTQEYNYKLCFLGDEKLAIVKIEGVISLKNVISTIDTIQLNPNCHTDFSFLVDVRSAEFYNEINIVKRYYLYVKRKYPHILEGQTVWLASKASQVVMVTLFKLLLGKLTRNSLVVSTVDYAISRLNFSIDRSHVRSVLENL